MSTPTTTLLASRVSSICSIWLRALYIQTNNGRVSEGRGARAGADTCQRTGPWYSAPWSSSVVDPGLCGDKWPVLPVPPLALLRRSPPGPDMASAVGQVWDEEGGGGGERMSWSSNHHTRDCRRLFGDHVGQTTSALPALLDLFPSLRLWSIQWLSPCVRVLMRTLPESTRCVQCAHNYRTRNRARSISSSSARALFLAKSRMIDAEYSAGHYFSLPSP